MPHKSETRAVARASRNSCGGPFRVPYTPSDTSEQTLAFHIHEFVPDAHGEELQHRISLLKARDYATWLLGVTFSRGAGNFACDALHFASEYVFADVPTVRLEIVVRFCRLLVQCAFTADHLDGEGAGS